jgi:hypothetical protein
VIRGFIKKLVISKLASGKKKKLYYFPTRRELDSIREIIKDKPPEVFFKETFVMLNIDQFIDKNDIEIFLEEITRLWQEKVLFLKANALYNQIELLASYPTQ